MSELRPTLQFESLAVGDVVATMELEITATTIAAGAIASRDFMPVHHDRDYAQSQGAPDIFMNILSDTAYCSRFLTDWAGPDAVIRRLAIRLGVPAHPRSYLAYTGSVTSLSTLGGADASGQGDGIVEVEFRASSELGDHLTGTAELGLPRRRQEA